MTFFTLHSSQLFFSFVIPHGMTMMSNTICFEPEVRFVGGDSNWECSKFQVSAEPWEYEAQCLLLRDQFSIYELLDYYWFTKQCGSHGTTLHPYMVHWQVYNESVFDLLARDAKDGWLCGHGDPSLDWRDFPLVWNVTDESSLGYGISLLLYRETLGKQL